MKNCCNCKKNLDDSEFSFSNKEKGTLSNYCRPCQKIKRRESYLKRREHFIQLANKTRKALNPRKRSLIQSLKDKPCADCKKSYPYYVMDFDHLPEFKKEISMGSKAYLCSDERILAEAAKCDVVCSNCHRERTWKRKNTK